MRGWVVVDIEPGTLNFELLYMVCDGQGMILERNYMDEFGGGFNAGISKHGLSSNMYDADTGLYYFAARWYAPDTGRFLQMDPVITEIGMINMYDYCNNNPLNVTDRYGEFWSLSEMWHGVKEIFGGDRAKRAYSEGDKGVSQEHDETERSPDTGEQMVDMNIVKKIMESFDEKSRELRKQYGVTEVTIPKTEHGKKAGVVLVGWGIPQTLGGIAVITIGFKHGVHGVHTVVHGTLMTGTGIAMIVIGAEMIKK